MKHIALSHAAQAAGIAPSTLDYYVRIGVANPAHDTNGRRLFSESDVQAVREYRAKHGRGR